LDHNQEVGIDFIIEVINETIGYSDDVSDEGYDPASARPSPYDRPVRTRRAEPAGGGRKAVDGGSERCARVGGCLREAATLFRLPT
jgi:hypothetical protein